MLVTAFSPRPTSSAARAHTQPSAHKIPSCVPLPEGQRQNILDELTVAAEGTVIEALLEGGDGALPGGSPMPLLTLSGGATVGTGANMRCGVGLGSGA